MTPSLTAFGGVLLVYCSILWAPIPSAVDDDPECVTQVTKYNGGGWELDCLNPCEEHCSVMMSVDQYGEPGYTCAMCPSGLYPPRCCHVVLINSEPPYASSAGNCDNLTPSCDHGNFCSVQSISSPTKIVYNPMCVTY